MDKRKLYIVGSVIAALVITLAVILVIALVKANPQPNTASDLPADFEIKLERGPCFGFCPIYTVTVNSKGEVTLIEDSFLSSRQGETYRYRVPVSDLQALEVAANNIKFFELKDRYVNELVTDLPSAEITITANGRTKSIYMYGLEDDIPAELTEFVDMVDDRLKVDEYLKNATDLPLEVDPSGETMLEGSGGDEEINPAY